MAPQSGNEDVFSEWFSSSDRLFEKEEKKQDKSMADKRASPSSSSTVTTAVVTKKRVKPTTRYKTTKILSKVMKKLVEAGFEQCKVVVFDLPTEYKGAETRFVEQGEKAVETRVLKYDPCTVREFRNLRSLFYSVLNRVAFRSRLGWILLKNAEEEELRSLAGIMGRLNVLAGKLGISKRVVEVIDILIPREFLARELEEFIAIKEMSLEKMEEKLQEYLAEGEEKKRVAKSLEYKINAFQEQLERLREELGRLTGIGGVE